MMKVEHNTEKCWFIIWEDGFEAHLAYQLTASVVDIRHTIVPQEIGGRGIAALLMETACNYAREHNYRIRATCAYASVWLKRHSGYDWEDACQGDSCAI